MGKSVATVDVVLQRLRAGWSASVLWDDDVAAIGTTKAEALEQLQRVLERVLRHRPSRYVDELEEARLVPRHLRLRIPAMRLGRLLQLDLQVYAVCRELADRVEVYLPQLSTSLSVKAADQLELMCEEWIRDHFPLETRLPTLLTCMGPLVDPSSDEAGWGLDQIDIRYRPEPVSSDDDETDQAPTLTAVGEPLHRRARSKDATRAFGRRGEVDTLLDYLGDSAERSVLLVGPAGVGKTAIVHEAVRRMSQGSVPDGLADIGVWQVSGGRLMAGMRYLGQWQERVLEVISDVRETGAVLFAENLIELLETAGTERHAEGIPGMLLPHILSGDLVFITEAQPEQLARAEQSHPSFLRALRRLPVDAMTPAETDDVLENVGYRLGRQFGVRLSPDTRQRVLELVGRFKGDAALPGPAVELAERMARTHRTQGVVSEGEDRPVLLPSHAVDAYSSVTGLPRVLLDPSADFDVDEVRRFFGSRIFAQPEPIDAMVDLVTCIRAGLNSPRRPLGSFLFLGPTGVGKTQTALTLAEYLFGSKERLVRLDMSEYQDPWAAGRLVGRYRGERGELVKRIREQPFSVVLLDEVEKAHSTVFDFLLQALGEGRLTDGMGQTVSLASTVVIMTSNLGAGGPDSLGFSRGGEAAERAAEVAHYKGAVEDFFRPEFVGRLDRVIPFRTLGHDTAEQLVKMALRQAFEREGLVRRKIQVRTSEDVVAFLIGVGFDKRYGARPLRRAVEVYITAPLAQFLARESGIEDIAIYFDMREGLPHLDLE